jgi:hypothetical protein
VAAAAAALWGRGEGGRGGEALHGHLPRANRHARVKCRGRCRGRGGLFVNCGAGWDRSVGNGRKEGRQKGVCPSARKPRCVVSEPPPYLIAAVKHGHKSQRRRKFRLACFVGRCRRRCCFRRRRGRGRRGRRRGVDSHRPVCKPHRKPEAEASWAVGGPGERSGAAKAAGPAAEAGPAEGRGAGVANVGVERQRTRRRLRESISGAQGGRE